MRGETTLERSPVLERDPIRIEVVETGWAPWYKVFREFHYLQGAKQMPFSTAFTGFDVATGDPVVFCGMTGFVAGDRRVARACRLVAHQEWQGAGISMRFLNGLCAREARGEGFIGAPVPTLMHTAHPALVAALKRDPKWTQVSQRLTGALGGKDKGKMLIKGKGKGYGQHFRAVAGFRYDHPEGEL